ncbi:hypothetical protein R3X27_15495 [Tropicimonas sp. TH_r6]|uniref:hypothetical protein n=1 Tax=Tropicimonas sp. TH_r6 TaxID=3082085 RepID=UPI0029536205|nr:hypothetical protein [Tropicimonas sp. TH_r6]MDV7144092.1 hypothetical protein [Tropicimonas sp. TH_r6]
MSNDSPINVATTGQRYSRNYEREEVLRHDCPRARRRVYRIADRTLPSPDNRLKFGLLVEEVIGIDVIESGPYSNYLSFEQFWHNLSRVDFFDAITLFYRFLAPVGRRDAQKGFRDAVEKVFRERQLAYTLDEDCGVHPYVDQEFDRNLTVCVRGLADETFAAARYNIETMEKALQGVPLDGRQAIRSVYDAAENIYQQMFGGNQIKSGEIASNLNPICQRLHQGHQRATSAAAKEVASFKAWVEACHNYRHEDGQPEPSQPPEELTILMVSQGLSFVRWLASLSAPVAEAPTE